MMTHATNIIIQHLLGSVLVFSLYAVAADPPDRPPGHGHREQHHQEHEAGDHGERGGRAQVIIEPRYGVLHGRCNREALGTVLSGALGGVAGNQISSGDPPAIAIGTVLGALLGNAAGQSLDQTDRACTQQVLQYARNGSPVQWVNGGMSYVVTPDALFHQGDRQCRNFVIVVRGGGRKWQEQRRACRGQGDSWYADP